MPKQKDNTIELITKKAQEVLERLSVKADVVVREDDSHYRIDIATEDANLLIGFKGQTLSALEHLLRVLCNEGKDEFISLSLDVGGYRAKRIGELERVAKEVAWRVKQTGKAETMPAMNAAERRHIHKVLNDIEGVVSESEGFGRDRRLVVRAQ